MPTVPVPLFNPVYKNVDGVALTDKSFKLINAFTDEEGYTNTRPGVQAVRSLSAYSAANTYVSGLYYWPHLGKVAVHGSDKFLLGSYSGGVLTLTDLTGTLSFTNARTPIFTTVAQSAAVSSTYLFVVNGGRMYYTDGTTALSAIADADAPTSVTHVVSLDGYILALNANSNQVNFSNVNNPLAWDALDRFSGASDADYGVALKVINREIYLFGANTLEVWVNDGQSPFSRTTSGAIKVGCSTPYAIAETDEGVIWLSDKRRFVSFNGGALTYLPTSYDKDIEKYPTVSDATSFRADIAGQQFVVFSFPSANKTLCYNLKTKEWAEWGRYKSLSETYDAMPIASYCYEASSAVHLVGSSLGYYIGQLTIDSPTDAPLGTAESIRGIRTTGHIDYGTTKDKLSQRLRIRVKRGEEGTSIEPVLMLRWKDNNKRWSQVHNLSLGSPGDTEILTRLRRTGIYATRQYELSWTDAVSVVFGGAEEDIDILR